MTLKQLNPFNRAKDELRKKLVSSQEERDRFTESAIRAAKIESAKQTLQQAGIQIGEDGSLMQLAFNHGYAVQWPYNPTGFTDDRTRISLNKPLTAEQLEALAFWVRHHQPQ